MSKEFGLSVVGALGMCWNGAGGVVGPGLSRAPVSSGGEVDAEGTGGAVGRKDFGEAIAELGKRGGEGVETGDGGHAGDVEGVAGCIKVAIESCGISAA
jgi:hypothetical protein